MRVRSLGVICVMGLVATACSATNASDPGTGEVGGECFDEDICDPGLRCVSGYCGQEEGDTDATAYTHDSIEGRRPTPDANGPTPDANGPTPDVTQRPVVAQVKIAGVQVLNDANGDGSLSPGETGSIDVTVENLGWDPVEGLFAELSVADPATTVVACQASVGELWADCDANCSCGAVVEAAKQSLQPDEVGSTPILRLILLVDSDAAIEPIAFGVQFTDALGSVWYDSFIVPLVGTPWVYIGETTTLADSNGDGLVNPGETVSVGVFAENYGGGIANGVWAQLDGSYDTATDAVVTITGCEVAVGDQRAECDTDCSCANAPEAALQTLAPGETGTAAVLVFTIEVDPNAPLEPLLFLVTFHDDLGTEWTDVVSIQVVPNAPQVPEVAIDHVTLFNDSTGDGLLSPGESATLQITPRNNGTSTALAVWAELSDAEPFVEVTSCATTSVDALVPCNAQCSCQDTGITQDVEAGQSSSQPILQFDFTLPASAPLQPISFEVTFHDEVGTTWTDTVTVALVERDVMIQVDSVDLWGDSNSDGVLTPGESAEVHVVARNDGADQAYGVYGSLVSVDTFVEVTACYAQFEGIWTECDTECSCANIADTAKVSLDSGETSDQALLAIHFDLPVDAPVGPIDWDIAFHDQLGNTWHDAFVVDVGQPPQVQVGAMTLQDDTNGDGLLSPSETASLVLYPQNIGSGTAHGVWAKLVAVEPGVTLIGCYAEAAGSWIECSASCNCEGVLESALQDLESGPTSEVPILRVDFELAPTLPVGPLSFGVAFTDNLGVAWTDLVLVDVVQPDAHVQVGLAELISDSGGNGILNVGESATVNVFAENMGTTTALGVWAALNDVSPHITVTSCYALNEEMWATCDLSCACESIPASIKSDIPPGEISDAVVLQISFDVSPSAPPGPQTFVLELTDSLNNTWEDTFSLEVLP